MVRVRRICFVNCELEQDKCECSMQGLSAFSSLNPLVLSNGQARLLFWLSFFPDRSLNLKAYKLLGEGIDEKLI